MLNAVDLLAASFSGSEAQHLMSPVVPDGSDLSTADDAAAEWSTREGNGGGRRDGGGEAAMRGTTSMSRRTERKRDRISPPGAPGTARAARTVAMTRTKERNPRDRIFPPRAAMRTTMARREERRERKWDRIFPFISRSRSGESSEDGEDGGGSEEGVAGEEPGGGRGLEASAGGGGSSSELMSLFVDPDVLDCPICFENLAPPVFQCNNGHIACSSCCVKVKSCPFCFHLINVRCLAIEKVVESIKIHCAYASSGCGEIVSYVHRHVHKETCIYSPCYCPTAECTFEGPIQKLYHHFSSTHGDCAVSFQYNLSFVACLPEDEAFRILRGEDGVLFLLLNKSEPPIFKAIIVACLGPDSMKEDYTYQVVARGKESSIQFESSMMNIRHREGVLPPTGFLLIPQGFYEVHLSLEIIVRKKASHIGSIITA